MAQKICQINDLMTKEQRYAAKRWDRMFVSRAVITSKAFLSLRTAAACQVYLIFLGKCRYEKVQGKQKRKNNYILSNNGEIQFSYNEAERKWGIKAGKFTRAIDELLRVGLIDVAQSGFGLHKDATLYAISDRWEKFGTDEFVVMERRKRKQQLGFTNKNKYGRNCKPKKKSTSIDNC